MITDPVFFVHIPKTAGSSLNVAAAKALGEDNIEMDYGPSAPETTPLVHQFMYNGNVVDQFSFFEAFQKNQKRWITGHVSADRYINLFGALNTLAFVRDPAARVISEYNYLQRRQTQTPSFTDYYRSPDETNKQYRMIGTLPWQAFRLVGTQERYDECISLLKKSLEMPLSAIHTNVAPPKDATKPSDETIKDIQKWNERDYQFVAQVRGYLKKQIQAHTEGHVFCYHDTGFAPDTHVIGWAFYKQNTRPVTVELLIDGVRRQSVQAVEARPELQLIGTPRQGHCGFRFVLAPYTTASHIMVRAAETEQSLFEWSRP